MITLTGGHIQNINAAALPNGSISFQLNLDATVIAPPGGFVPSATEVVFQFDASGNIQSGAKIYSNAELNPQNASGLGTYYLVTVFDANGSRLNQSPMAWQFDQISGSTVDISNMVPILTIRGAVIYYPASVGGGGSVTSVGLQMDGVIFNSSVSGSPVTTSGTLIPSLLSQTAHFVLIGPTSGSPATPTFRALTLADLPAGLGTVTSVSVGNLSPLFTASVATSTTTPAITFAQVSQNANLIFGGPSSGGAANPTFRNLVNADFPVSGVTAGSYTNANITVNAQGIVTVAANGSSGFSNPMTTLGDTMYENATPAAARLPGNTTTQREFLSQTGNGSISAAPVWNPLPYDISLYTPGVFLGGQQLVTIPIAGCIFPSGLTGSIANLAVASTGTLVFAIQQNGVTFGTVTFTSSSSGVVTSSSQTTFASGDVFGVIVSSGAPDATASTLSLFIPTTRT